MGQGTCKEADVPPDKSVEVDRMMSVKCQGGHRHVHLMSGRARVAASYPAKLCRALCKGKRRQTKVDASGMLSTLIMAGWHDEVGEVSHVPEDNVLG